MMTTTMKQYLSCFSSSTTTRKYCFCVAHFNLWIKIDTGLVMCSTIYLPFVVHIYEVCGQRVRFLRNHACELWNPEFDAHLDFFVQGFFWNWKRNWGRGPGQRSSQVVRSLSHNDNFCQIYAITYLLPRRKSFPATLSFFFISYQSAVATKKRNPSAATRLRDNGGC